MPQTLCELAQGGRALELGIGTGRVALPLQALGVEVHGVDASPAMVAKLRSKPGGEQIPVTMGDFTDTPVEGLFSLIYIAFNTFYALLTQDSQLRCLQNVARHLTPSGVYVMEGFIPDLTRFQGDQAVRAVEVSMDQVRIDVSQIDRLAQQITAQHLILTNQGVQLFPVKLRYVWLSELDLMARLAGMRLKHRWGSWDKAPLTGNSGRHVSVFELDGKSFIIE
jgi:SAM-dependent methyltransferase